MEPMPPKKGQGGWPRTALSVCSVLIGLAMLVFGGIFLSSSIPALITGDVIDPANAYSGLALGIVLAGVGIVLLLLGIKSLRKNRRVRK